MNSNHYALYWNKNRPILRQLRKWHPSRKDPKFRTMFLKRKLRRKKPRKSKKPILQMKIQRKEIVHLITNSSNSLKLILIQFMNHPVVLKLKIKNRKKHSRKFLLKSHQLKTVSEQAWEIHSNHQLLKKSLRRDHMLK